MRKTHAFSTKAFNSPTPTWAKNMFRISYLLTKVVIAWIAVTKIFTTGTQLEVTLFLTLVVDPFIYGLSKMFGVEIEK